MSDMLDETVDDVVDTTTDGAAVDAGEPVARADEPAEPAAPSAPSIDWNDPDVQQQVGAVSQQQMLGLLEQLGLVSYEDDQPTPPDPLSDNFAAESQAYTEALLAKHLGPIQDYFRAQEAEKTNAAIDGALGSAAKAAGLSDIDNSVLRAVAGQFATRPEYARLGATQQGVEATAKAAAEWIARERKTAGDAAVLNYRKQIGEIQDTPAEPSANGGGGLPIEQAPKSYDDVLRKHGLL